MPWRDRLKVHPAADLFPMMSHDELLELGNDIKANGLRVPVVLWTPESWETVHRKRMTWDRYPREIFLLDGRNRLDAIEAVAIELFDDELGRLSPQIAGPRPEIIYGGDFTRPDEFDRVDPYHYVMSANLRRRHLTSEQKRELIDKLLRAKPERSDRATASLAKVDHKTVSAVRAKGEARGEIPHLEQRVDSTGRRQPAARKSPTRSTASAPIPAVPATAPAAAPLTDRSPARKPRSRIGAGKKRAPSRSASQVRDTAIVQFSLIFRKKLRDTFDDLTRIFRDEHARIVAEIPTATRAAFARECLGLKPDDLATDH